MLSKVFGAVLVVAFSIFDPCNAQSLEEDQFSSKLGTTTIVNELKAGASLELLVSLEAGGLEAGIAKERVKNASEAEAKKAKPGIAAAEKKAIEATAAAQDANLLQSLQNQLHAIKDATFPSGRLGDIEVIQDFPSSPVVMVRVSSLGSLRLLLRQPSVKRIHKNDKITPTASWPSSYSDVAIIHSNVNTGADGRTGKDTRVVVLDTAAYLWAVPGWNPAQESCFPYNGETFSNANLGMGGKAIASNCRIWSAYNFSNSNIADYCAGR